MCIRDRYDTLCNILCNDKRNRLNLEKFGRYRGKNNFCVHLLDACNSVSYTHLDVYKRQLLENVYANNKM